MNSIMGTVQGKLIDAQKIRDKREKEIMIQREKMSENVRKLVRERTDLMNINHNLYNNDLKKLNKNSISMTNLNMGNKNHNLIRNRHSQNSKSVDNFLNSYNSFHSNSTVDIEGENTNSINHIYKNINDNKKTIHGNENTESKYNDILNIWTFPNNKTSFHTNTNENNNINTNNIINSNIIFNDSNEINNNNNNGATIFNESNVFDSPKKKKNEYYNLNNRNVRLKSLKHINKSGNDNININKTNNNNNNNNNNNKKRRRNNINIDEAEEIINNKIKNLDKIIESGRKGKFPEINNTIDNTDNITKFNRKKKISEINYDNTDNINNTNKLNRKRKISKINHNNTNNKNNFNETNRKRKILK